MIVAGLLLARITRTFFAQSLQLPVAANDNDVGPEPDKDSL